MCVCVCVCVCVCEKQDNIIQEDVKSRHFYYFKIVLNFVGRWYIIIIIINILSPTNFSLFLINVYLCSFFQIYQPLRTGRI